MKTESHPVELLLLGGAVLAMAAASVVRLLLVPVLAWLWVLTHRRPVVQQVEATLPVPTRTSEQAASLSPQGAATPTLTALAEELLALPAAELRNLAGTRRRCSKRETVAMLLAMPI